MHKLQIISIGESAGVILPEEVMARLGASEGDTICLTQAVDGGYRVTLSSAVFEGHPRDVGMCSNGSDRRLDPRKMDDSVLNPTY